MISLFIIIIIIIIIIINRAVITLRDTINLFCAAR